MPQIKEGESLHPWFTNQMLIITTFPKFRDILEGLEERMMNIGTAATDMVNEARKTAVSLARETRDSTFMSDERDNAE